MLVDVGTNGDLDAFVTQKSQSGLHNKAGAKQERLPRCRQSVILNQ